MTERKAGFKLDTEVDEKVFGHTIGWRKSFSWRTDIISEIQARARGFDLITESRIAGAWVPHYSTSIADAWEVVEKMRGRRLDFYLRFVTTWTAEFDSVEDSLNGYANGDTAPLAICRAALSSFPDSTKEGE